MPGLLLPVRGSGSRVEGASGVSASGVSLSSPGVSRSCSAVRSAAAARYRGRAQENPRASPPGLRERGRAPLPPGTECSRQKERAPPAPCVRFPGGLRSRSAGAGPRLCRRNAAFLCRGRAGIAGERAGGWDRGDRRDRGDSGERGRARRSPPAPAEPLTPETTGALGSAGPSRGGENTR